MAFIYGFIMTIMMLIVNILIANMLNVDIYILFFCDIVAILSMIWHKLTTKGDENEIN